MSTRRFVSFVLATAAALSTSGLAVGDSDKTIIWNKGTREIVAVTGYPCMPALTLEVSYQLRWSLWEDGRGATHIRVHFNTAYFRATDEDGNVYSGTHQISNHVLLPTADPRTFTELGNIRLVSQGPGANLIVTYHMILTLTPNGDLAVHTMVDDVKCVA